MQKDLKKKQSIEKKGRETQQNMIKYNQKKTEGKTENQGAENEVNGHKEEKY